jgi:hypothetical protein
MILIILKFFINYIKWFDELDAKVDGEVHNVHVKRIDMEDLVDYVYIVRVDVFLILCWRSLAAFSLSHRRTHTWNSHKLEIGTQYTDTWFKQDQNE